MSYTGRSRGLTFARYAMNRFTLCLFASTALALSAPAADKPSSPRPSGEAAALAARIDAILEGAWSANKITPAQAATDPEFLRRVYLDLAGRIPTVAEARAFLADKGADKRRHLVAQLLERPTYARHMTTVWRHVLIPEAETETRRPIFTIQFENWLREEFTKNVSYDQMVREMLTTRIDQQINRLNNPDDAKVMSPVAFFYAKESKPENLAASSARVFLGLRLECAQCHNHPFATWTRDQFWGLAAFFAGVRSQFGNGIGLPGKEVLNRRDIQVPDTGRSVQARFPNGAEPQWRPDVPPREILAEWVTDKNNPYFAPATVNLVWTQMFGAGLVDPADETPGQGIKTGDEDLLDVLAKSFVAHQYDLKFLIEAIAGSKAYQLSSKGAGTAPLFSRQPLRGLTGEQLYDSLFVATGEPNAVSEVPSPIRLRNGARADFVAKFGQQNAKATEHETSIVQALTMMNGYFVGAATDLQRSELLGAVLRSPFFDDKSRVETLYLATLSRLPTEKEMQKAQSYIGHPASGADPEKAHDEAVADVFWALINSAEFVFNH